MTIYEELQNHLELSSKARERKQKNKFIAWILSKKPKYRDLPLDVIADLIVDSSSYDRAWRKVLQDNPHLRGTDYGDKDDLEDAKRQELGYKEPTP